MKKIIFAVALLTASSLAYASYTYGQCQAIAKSTGQQCKRGVSNAGDKFCYQHK